jgi:hypothetical protein
MCASKYFWGRRGTCCSSFKSALLNLNDRNHGHRCPCNHDILLLLHSSPVSLAKLGLQLCNQLLFGISSILLWSSNFANAVFKQNVYYGTLYAYTPEVLPSAHRGTGNGIAIGFNRIMGIISAVIATVANVCLHVSLLIACKLMINIRLQRLSRSIFARRCTSLWLALLSYSRSSLMGLGVLDV